jgi:hypothetical protein
LEGKKERTKKFRVIEIGGIPGVAVSSWEEQQEAIKQGYKNIHYIEKRQKNS